jgi:hypothetical protein
VVTDLTPAEAWALAWRVVCDTDPEIDGSFERACERAHCPPRVVEAIRAFGLPSLCVGGGRNLEGDNRRVDPVSVQRGQFVAIYEQLAGRDRRMALLPAGVRAAIDTHRERVNGPVAAIAGRLAESFATPEV